ncbi:hypothetical protein [Spirillospora sp. CA-294931]|uniref:hypothetical protein n=1 Tax=Spirillospora sp. CA-294931 TaxID=3240042 RepID=UPI003D9403D5
MDVTGHLDALGGALAEAGWSSLSRYHEKPPLLRVFHPATPWFGDSVSVADSLEGTPWFWSSTGDPLAPCADLEKAVARVEEQITSFEPMAERFGLSRLSSAQWRRLLDGLRR